MKIVPYGYYTLNEFFNMLGMAYYGQAWDEKEMLTEKILKNAPIIKDFLNKNVEQASRSIITDEKAQELQERLSVHYNIN